MGHWILRRGDLSWPIGWAAVVLQAVSFASLMNAGQCSGCAMAYIKEIAWLGGGVASLLSFRVAAGLAAAHHNPTGKGWIPGLAGLVLMVGNVYVQLGGLDQFGIGPVLGPS